MVTEKNVCHILGILVCFLTHSFIIKKKGDGFATRLCLIAGYHCEEHNNPADFILDIINKCERQKAIANS